MQDVFSEFFSLKGKTAVVTGSGRGIGKAIATMLARAGADVVIWDIIKENAEATAKEIAETTGRKTWVYMGDLLQQEKIKEYVQDILSLCGKVDILVNNAGVQVRKTRIGDYHRRMVPGTQYPSHRHLSRYPGFCPSLHPARGGGR
jgi:NAD(P)-dependent dehydrogenase (short-subunit alcohol dehydrogenase family)